MNLAYRRRPRRATTTLVVTFVLGLGTGFTLFYALADAMGWNFSGTAELPAPPAPITMPSIPETGPGDPAPAAAIPAVPKTDLEPLGAAAHIFLILPAGPLDAAHRDLLGVIKPAGVWLETNAPLDEAQIAAIVKEIKEAAGLGADLHSPPLIVLAQEGGPNANPLGLENAPSAEELGRAPGTAEAREAGKRAANAVRPRGIGMIAAPVLDVFRPGLSDPVMKERMFGESIDTVKNMGLAFAEGVLEGGALPLAKHYPGLGAAVRQEDGSLAIRLAANAGAPEQQSEIRQLAELMFPFSEAAAARIPAMFVAHIAVPALDPEFPALPASASPKLAQRLLREQWKYDGVLLAEDLTQSPLMKDKPLEQIAVAALIAGCDAVLLRSTDAAQIQAVCAALAQECPAQRREVSRARIEALFNRLTESAAPEPTAASETPDASEPPVVSEAPAVPAAPVASEGSTEPEPPLAPEPPPVLETPAAPAEEPSPTPPAPESPETPPAADDVEVKEAADAAEDAAPATDDSSAEPQTAEPEKPSATPPEKSAEPAPAARVPAAQPPNTRLVRHTVKRGETLMAIGRTYGVSTSDLIAWNAFANANRINYGQTVIVYAPETALENTVPVSVPPPPATETPAPVSEAEPVFIEKDANAPETQETAPPADAPMETGFEYYTVRRGDTLDRIARKHHTSKDVLLKMNTLSNPDVLPMGIRVKVPKPNESRE